MNPLQDKAVRSLVIAVLSMLSVFLLVVSVSGLINMDKKDSTMPPNVITVRGTGEAVGTPDVATFIFTVREQGKDVVAVQKTMTEKASKAIDYLKEKGVDKKDIKVQSYTTNPRYEYPNGRQVQAGFDVSETVLVKVRDLEKAGELLTGVTNLRIGEVGSLLLTIDDMDSLKLEAKKQAIEKAREEAKQIARSLGVDLEKVTSYYEDYPYEPIAYGGAERDVMMSAVKAQGAPVPIEPGEQKVMITVSVTYEID